MAGGRVTLRDSIDVAGYHLATPSVDIHTVGAGGGTLAGVDSAGMLFVGPHGAGARPGPACYGLGGKEPTVTDAQVVLGRMRAGSYADGAVTLNAKLARKAIDKKVAQPLGIDVAGAATGIVQLLEQRLVQAVERISSERGLDPSRFILVAAGGAGPLHGVTVARALGIRQVYVPRQAGGFCALGMLHSDVRHDLLRVFLSPLEDVDPTRLEAVYGELEARGEAELKREGFADQDRRLVRLMDLRYRAQQWSVTVVTPASPRADLAGVRRAFEDEHDRLFGHVQPGGDVEITALRVVATGLLRPPQPPAWPQNAGRPLRASRRRVYVDPSCGWRETDVFTGNELQPGHRLAGPLIVEEDTSTILVGVGDTLSVDEAGNFLIDVRCQDSDDVRCGNSDDVRCRDSDDVHSRDSDEA